jgi:predicted GIY-YIG superfamily endonuclease
MSATSFEYVSPRHKALVEAGILSTSEPYQVYPDNTKGYVYIIHLARPLRGSKSRHYVGFSTQVEKRLWHHRKGTGSHFLREANRQGIPYALVVVFRGTKRDERKLKNRKNTPLYCPCCNPCNPRQYVSKELLPHEREYKFTDL